MSVQIVLYIIGNNAYVHIRAACSISRIRMFVPVEFRIIPWEDI